MGGRSTAFFIAGLFNFAYNLAICIAFVIEDVGRETAGAMLFGTVAMFAAMNGFVFIVFPKREFKPIPVPTNEPEPEFVISDEIDDLDAPLH